METREIPRDEWFDFFQDFSRRHYGWRVTIEAFGREFGAQIAARELALGEIAAELPPAGTGDVTIILGGGDEGSPLTHTVHEPRRILLKVGADGADEAVEIQHRDGSVTVLTFRETLPPEQMEAAEGEAVGSRRER